MSGYAARGSIVFKGEVLVKESGFNKTGCSTLLSAKIRVVKGLANKLRTRMEGVEGWINWPDLPSAQQQAWLSRVAETLQWDELHEGKEAHLSHVDATGFRSALNGAWA